MKTIIFASFLFYSIQGHSQYINTIVAFGDSFTDNGHVNGHGFNRDTNGKVWVDYLSDMLDCVNLDNRAWGGARTDSGHFTGLDWSGFNWQVENYSMTSEPTKTLYTIWIGINDYWDAKDDPTCSVLNIKKGIQKLIEKGAKRFVVFNNFDLTLAPGYGPKTEYHDLIPQVRVLISEYNDEISQMILNEETGLITKSPEVEITFIDIFTFMNELIKSKKYLNTDTPWKDSYKFPHPNEFLWYDEWHPMTSCHLEIAQLVYKKLELGK
jgi:thermolabile hemolysin